MTPSASAASVIETGDTAFRVCFGDPDQGTLAAQELTSKYKKIGAIYDTSDTYSQGIYDAFKAKMNELGVSYIEQTFDKENKRDFPLRLPLLKIAALSSFPSTTPRRDLLQRPALPRAATRFSSDVTDLTA